jgi:hypothetical protein
MKSASQIVTAQRFKLPGAEDGHGFQHFLAMSLNRPTVCREWNLRNVSLDLQALADFLGMP